VENKIEEKQRYAVAGTDSWFEVIKCLENGGLTVKWDTGSEVELTGKQVADYIANGQLKLVVEGEVPPVVVPAPAETTAPATEKKEEAQPEAVGRLRVKRVVRHVPVEKYVEVLKKAAEMSHEEFETMFGARPVKAQ
jgi:hypothetical protein